MAKPHDHDDVQPTEAVAFDPFADDLDDDPGTEAVAFDPFADDDDLDDDSDAEYSTLR